MSDKKLVWDLPLRLFHWLLVLSMAASWYTAENSEEIFMLRGFPYSYTELHFWLGYWTLGLILFRILWGFVGPRHARFASFLPGPSRVLGYAKSFLKRDSSPTVGHNPMGAWMVVLMLLMVGAQAVSGLFLLDNTEIYPAPFNPAVDPETAASLGKFHHINFDVLLWIICLHVLAILFYRFYKNQNLVVPMITGRKAVSAEQAIKSSRLLLALVVIVVAAAIVWLVLQQAPPPPELYEDY